MPKMKSHRGAAKRFRLTATAHGTTVTASVFAKRL